MKRRSSGRGGPTRSAAAEQFLLAMLLAGAAGLLLLLTLGVPGGVTTRPPPLSGGPSLLAPRDVARMAVDTYNQGGGTGTQAVFRLLKIRSTVKTRFGWGVHFSMNFTVKETTCRKTSSYKIESCKYKPNGLIRDCSAEVSVLSLVDDAPLMSVQCHPLQRGNNPSNKKARPNSRPRAVTALHVEHYYPSSYSTAALTAVEGE